jgi:hypothetical protein
MRNNWKIADYINELIHLDEISEIPGVSETIQVILKEMWGKFSQEECENNFVSKPKTVDITC